MRQLPPIVSLDRFRCALVPWRSGQRAMLTLVCKATYALAPIESKLADEQEYPFEEDDHWDDDAAKSLRAAREMVPMKPRPEVLVVGSAFTPGGKPLRSVLVRVVVGQVDKSILVAGDRYVGPDGRVTDPAQFTRMPLRYERAAGGPTTPNPVGVRDEHMDGYGRRALPNLLPQDFNSLAVPPTIAPMGLGPLSPSWPVRVARLGPRAKGWVDRGSFDEPLPEDLDPTYFLAAPLDQGLDALRPNERLVLEHLHPSHPRLVTSLPGVEPRVFVETVEGAPHELTMRCDTLWIDSDRAICTLTWRAQFARERPTPLRVIVASASLGQRLAWADIAPRLIAAGCGPALEPDTLDPESVDAEPDYLEASNMTLPIFTASSAALPFVAPERAPSRRESSAALPFVAPEPAAARRESSAALPFVAPEPAAARREPERPKADGAAGPAPSRPDVAKPHLVFAKPAAAAPEADSSPWAASAPAAPASAIGWERGASASNERPELEGAIAIPRSHDQVVPNLQGRSAAALASDAAAGLRGNDTAPARSAPKSAAPPASRGTGRAFVDLLWFDPEVVPRLRAAAAFKDLFSAPGERTWRKMDAPVADERADAGGKRDVMRVITGATPLDGEPLRRAIEAAFADPVSFAHPLVVVVGDLAPSFDELASLKALVQLGGPLAGTDKRAREALNVATEALRASEPLRETALGLVRLTLQAFGQSAPTLEGAMTRTLLDGRSYRKRRLFGSSRVRAELALAGHAQPLPVYLPESIELLLPALARFRVRLLAEWRPQEDHAESVGDCLLAFAVARVVRG